MDRHISFIVDTQSAESAISTPATSPEQPSPMDPAHCFVLGADQARVGDTLYLRVCPLALRGEDTLLLHSVQVDETVLSALDHQVREVQVPVPDFNDPLQITSQAASDHVWTGRLEQDGPCAITLGLALIARDCTLKGFFTTTVQLAFAP